MNRTRRLAGIAALAAASASILVVPGAGAQEGGTTYAGSSDGRALALNVFGQGLTAGLTHSEAASSGEASDAPFAVATGTGILNPISPVGVSAAAEPDAALPEGATETEGEQCGGALPAELAAAGIAADFACSTSTASAGGGLPSSTSASRVSAIQLNPVNAINQTPLGEVVEGVEGGVDQLLGGLDPLFQGIDEGTGLTTDNFVEDLFELLLNGAPLATVTVGDTASATTATTETVVTECTAEGARIDVLDPAGMELEGVEVDAPPLVSIQVGASSTKVTATHATGEAVAEATPAIATVRAPALGEAFAEIAVGPGTAQTIALPEPLGNIVISAAGTVEENPEGGGKSIQASAVRVHLFQGSEPLMDGVELALADCLSVAAATAPAPVAPAPPIEPAIPSLPRTGTDGPNGLALAATVGLAGLGLALLRRTRLV